MALFLPLIILTDAVHCLPCWWLISPVSFGQLQTKHLMSYYFQGMLLFQVPVQSIGQKLLSKVSTAFFSTIFCSASMNLSYWAEFNLLSFQLQKTLGSKQGSKSSPHTSPSHGSPSKFPFRFFWKPAPSLPPKAKSLALTSEVNVVAGRCLPLYEISASRNSS